MLSIYHSLRLRYCSFFVLPLVGRSSLNLLTAQDAYYNGLQAALMTDFGLPAGSYLLRLKTQEGVGTKLIILQ